MSGERFRQAEDRPAVKVAVIVLAAALVVFAIATLLFGWILHNETGHVATHPAMPVGEAGKAEVGIVNQPLFDIDSRTPDRIAAQRKHLDNYGWIDRRSGTIHIPIERAMEQVIAEARAEEAPQARGASRDNKDGGGR